MGVREVWVLRLGGVAGVGGEGGRDCGMGPGRVAIELRALDRFVCSDAINRRVLLTYFVS